MLLPLKTRKGGAKSTQSQQEEGNYTGKRRNIAEIENRETIENLTERKTGLCGKVHKLKNFYQD